MLVPFRQMWCLSEPNIDGFFLSSLILQIRKIHLIINHQSNIVIRQLSNLEENDS